MDVRGLGLALVALRLAQPVRVLDRAQVVQPGESAAQISALINEVSAPPKPMDRIPIKSNGKVTFVNLSEIDWVGSADNYVELHVGSHSHLLRETMTSLESRLDPQRFVRISRAAIVAIAQIREVQPLFNGDFVVLLKNGAQVNGSRRYRAALDVLLR